MASRAQTAALVMALAITAALRVADLATRGHELADQQQATTTTKPPTGDDDDVPAAAAASATAALLLVSVTYFLSVIVVHVELVLVPPAPNGIVAVGTASFAAVVACLLALSAAARV